MYDNVQEKKFLKSNLCSVLGVALFCCHFSKKKKKYKISYKTKLPMYLKKM